MPDHKFKGLWTSVIIMLLIYTAIFVPVKIAFVNDTAQSLVVLDTIVDVLFFIDIIVNFLSATETKSGKLITDNKAIAKNYITGWFWLDLVACIPFDLLQEDESPSSGNNELIRLLRLPRLYRLVRLMRLVKMVRVLKNSRLITELIELV